MLILNLNGSAQLRLAAYFNSKITLKEIDSCFSIAGKDQVFYWANAQLKNKAVYICSDLVENPTAVRYAWANNPRLCIFDTKGLPAFPFRTDNWQIHELNEIIKSNE